MKLIRKCPVLILLISTGILFTIIGLSGKDNLYAGQSYDPVTAPVLSVMFTGLKEGLYPWQILSAKTTEAMVPAMTPSGEPAKDPEPAKEPAEEVSPSLSPLPSAEPAESAEPVRTPSAEETYEGRPTPLRESTYEEYINHISADIYGDMGVVRAAAYDFETVEESYFDDAIFIGDSRTVGLRDYTDLSEHADFYCETSLTIYKVMEETFGSKGTIAEALENKDYGKIYLMVGINELGRGTTEDFMQKYTEVVDTLHALAPEAKIFIQGIMRVSGEKDSSDEIFNNSNINARNHAIATLADNQQFFYIDVNEVVCDEEGNLNAAYTFDQIHLLGVYNELWKQFLLEHGVTD